MRAPTSPFVVRVPEIPPEGIRRAFDLGGAFMEKALEGTEAHPSESTANAQLDLYRTGRDVVARGKISGELTVVCSRCAGPAHVSIDEKLALMFVPRGHDTEAPDPEEGVDQPDVLPYDGDEIDLAETLREELLLALPIAPLCNENCLGLCPKCGADLNEGSCDCPEEPKDERFAPLRNLKV